MCKKPLRRVTMAAGAVLAGAAIPIAAAGTAWADDIDISYDGNTIIDTFPTADQPDVASGTDNDFAIASGPESSGSTITAIDNAPGDANDVVKASGAGSGADIIGATNSQATAAGGGAAVVESTGSSPVANDTATADNGLAAVVDSSGSNATAENTGLTDGAVVYNAIDSTASANGTGSIAVGAGVPSTVIDSSALDTNGSVSTFTTSDTFEFNGAPLGDLLAGSPPTGGEDMLTVELGFLGLATLGDSLPYF